MPKLGAVIANSRTYPGEVTLRADTLDRRGLRALLTKAGFTPGDLVVVISAAELNALEEEREKVGAAILNAHWAGYKAGEGDGFKQRTRAAVLEEILKNASAQIEKLEAALKEKT